MNNYQNEEYFTDKDYKFIHDCYSLAFLGLFLSYLTVLLTVFYAGINYKKYKNNPLINSHLKYILSGCLYYTLIAIFCFALIYWNYKLALFSKGHLIEGLGIYIFCGLYPFIYWIARFISGFKKLRNKEILKKPYFIGLPNQ